MSAQPEVLRPAKAAAYLGFSRRKLYDLAEIDPTFPRKIVFSSRCVGYRRESLDSWLLEKEQQAGGEE
ncbi:MAG: AlpA family phage regulatory protein [Candidatus Thiodiazotropha sp. (ex Myrtea sp. 'scaly one' KF741663)]|nr:AlpA family phage regulatory protein [Candidatus Thiodiazotropha sp. (ex Myrtea sp. 'scaly one' KF741663)]